MTGATDAASAIRLSQAFWADNGYDVENADDGVSRLGAYVCQTTRFADDYTGDPVTVDPVRFAVAAWQTATGPVMVPGYIRTHPRVLSNGLSRSSDDGTLVAHVELLVPPPEQLHRALRGYAFPHWDHDGATLEWPRGAQQQASSSLVLLRTLATGLLHVPDPPHLGGDRANLSDVETAVKVVAAWWNMQLRPVLEALQAG